MRSSKIGEVGGGSGISRGAKLTLRQRAGKAIVNATTGKYNARNYAESKMRENAKPKLPSSKTKPMKDSKSSVRVKPRRTASGPGLETRGNKITVASQKKSALKIENNQFEKFMERRFDTNPGGPRAGSEGARGASAKKITRNKAIVRAADKKLPVKIESGSKLSPSSKANARGLKAANKPVSKNNAGQTAGKLKVDILKRATPARANRTRLGKSAFKSK
jgi:hypothetical protein